MPQQSPLLESEKATKQAPASESKGGFIVSGFSSTILWILAFVCILELFLIFLKPIKFFTIEGVQLKEQDPVGLKIETVKNPLSTYDTLLLGTSLVNSAAVCADVSSRNLKLNQVERWKYLPCKYFDEIILKQTNTKITSINLGIGGAMVGEDLTVLEKALSSGHNPRLIVLTLSVREFIDNTYVPQASALSCALKRSGADLGLQAPLETANYFLGKIWSLYGHREDYATAISSTVSYWCDRPLYPSMGGKRNKIPKVTLALDAPPYSSFNDSLDRDSVETIKEFYQSAYKKVDPKILNVQWKKFEKLLSLIQEKKIPVVAVFMPLSTINRNQIPAGFEQELTDKIVACFSARKIKFIDLIGYLPDQDFVDGVHMNASGAKKFWSEVGKNVSPELLIGK